MTTGTPTKSWDSGGPRRSVVLPHSKIEGEWFHAGDWQGNPLKTVHVNLKTGRWHVTERRWVSAAPGATQ